MVKCAFSYALRQSVEKANTVENMVDKATDRNEMTAVMSQPAQLVDDIRKC